MNPMLLLPSLLFLMSVQYADAAVTVSYTVASSWTGGRQLQFVFTNTGSTAVCAVTFSLSFPSGTTIASSWNMDVVSGSSTEYTLPSWLNIGAGASYSDTGMTTSGTGNPTLSVLSYSECGSGSDTTTTTTTPAGTTTTTTASGTTTTTTATSSSGTTLVVSPVYTTKDTCLSESSAYGPSTAKLNTAITDGKFTFYGIGGRAACGLDTDTPTKSAAASGTLFNSSAPWVASCMPDGRYMLNDPICINKCVKIQYNGKTLTVPINNKCPECELNHVDLSEEAFLWLEPAGGTVGVATGATITYIECS